jgi:hypothetical protein
MIHKNEGLCPLQGEGEETLRPWVDACKCFHVVHGCNYNMPILMLGCGFGTTWPMLNQLHKKAMPHLHQDSIMFPIRPQPQTIVGVCCSQTQSSCVDFDNIEWGHFQLIHKCTNPHDDQLIFFSLTLTRPSILHGNFQLQHWCLAQDMVDFEIQPPTCESYVANFPPCIFEIH